MIIIWLTNLYFGILWFIKSLSQVKKERSKSLAVFGTLVSPKLRDAQLSFETGLKVLLSSFCLSCALITFSIYEDNYFAFSLNKFPSYFLTYSFGKTGRDSKCAVINAICF